MNGEEDATTKSNQSLVAELSRFATIRDLKRSGLYRERWDHLRRLFDRPTIYECSDSRPRLQSFLRVVEWNIERGRELEGIIDALNNHPVLRWADLLLLNELDDGMARSGNLSVARELGASLGARAIYGVEYLELTKGAGDELNLPGDNTAALHGNAILTRHRFSNVELVRLPRCENNFESGERRLGGRAGILADLDVHGVSLLAATTHLDVVNSPRCRARQMRALLYAIERRTQARKNAGKPRAIIGGDLNTHTFKRTGRVRAVRNVASILRADRARLAQRLLTPHRQEPALSEIGRFGFQLEGFNDTRATSRSVLSPVSFPDVRLVPGFVKRWALARAGPSGVLMEFRLDWLAGRGLKPLRAGEVVDTRTGISSVDPQTFGQLSFAGSPISDHDPIVVDVILEP